MIVMKFGGTSVEDSSAIDRAAKIVAARRERFGFSLAFHFAVVTWASTIAFPYVGEFP